MNFRLEVNRQIRQYWIQAKRQGLISYQAISKKKHPSFTRHNGRKIARLSRTGWRYPRSTQGNRGSITMPKIGYRNPAAVRHCLQAYGKRIGLITNQRELEMVHAQDMIPVISARVGGRRRGRLLAYAKDRKLPLMLRG